jgi:hypothetical protein
VSGAEGVVDGMLPGASYCGDGDDGGAAAAGLVGAASREGAVEVEDAAVMSSGHLATISGKVPHQHLRPLG